MKISTLTLLSSAMTAASIAVAPAAYAGPTVAQQCDAQTWPRPVPDVVGMMFDPAEPIKTDGFTLPGSVNPRCTYRSPGRTAVTTALYVTGAFPVDAAADYARSAGAENATAIDGLGQQAHCLTNLHGAQGRPYNEVVVLLDGNRLFEAEGLGAEPCEQLKTFAQTAINRI